MFQILQNVQPKSARRPLFLVILIAVWLLAIASAFAALAKYQSTAGPRALAADTWPADVSLPRDPHRATLVMVLHPLCPCSVASVNELTAIAADCSGALSIDVLFSAPAELAGDVQLTDLYTKAGQIVGAFLIQDRGGAIARRLGAATSGQVFLYTADGVLRFSGGITSARGHAGNNAGREAIEAILHGVDPDRRHTPVFGCALSSAR